MVKKTGISWSVRNFLRGIGTLRSPSRENGELRRIPPAGRRAPPVGGARLARGHTLTSYQVNFLIVGHPCTTCTPISCPTSARTSPRSLHLCLPRTKILQQLRRLRISRRGQAQTRALPHTLPRRARGTSSAQEGSYAESASASVYVRPPLPHVPLPCTAVRVRLSPTNPDTQLAALSAATCFAGRGQLCLFYNM
jgi:hypothetical protein